MHWAEPVAFDFGGKIKHKKKVPKEPLDTYITYITFYRTYITLSITLSITLIHFVAH